MGQEEDGRDDRQKVPHDAAVATPAASALLAGAGSVSANLLVAPAAMLQTPLGENLARCEAAWREGEPAAVAEAMTLLLFHGAPPPLWLEEAVVQIAVGRRTDQEAERHRELQRHWERYKLVCELHDKGLTLEKAFEQTAKRFHVSTSTVTTSYKMVKRDQKLGRALGRYFNPADPRYRDL